MMQTGNEEQQQTKKPKARHSIGAKKNPQTEIAILEATAQIIKEKGISGLKMEAVARKAKAGKATLYRWWPTRGALLLALYQRKKPQLNYADTGSLHEDLLHFTHDLIAIWKGENGLFFKAIIAESQSDPDVAEQLKRYHAERLEALSALFSRAQTRGEIPQHENPAIRAEMLMNLLWQRLLNNGLEEDIDEHILVLANSDRK
ncbi:TetR/AcrR family transcriptional regulator [uncultured Cohaesibacter sp.]|uniref:TetR/AcrR family transcriptional regulator n=1 Tax=uncultured Cohaesibacter sp. TaxID=1002546 RepID=UPI0029C6B303|nr:TetR/AcrR family transcriptional regulator [uncultured Cohaesibacter sp.]